MKVVIEGPSAVGKTTLCNAIRKNYSSVVLEEPRMKPLKDFSPFDEAVYYLNNELNRWNLSNSLSDNTELVLFDTDPFKSLWFNWSLGFKSCLSLEELDSIIRPKVQSKEVYFPELYVVLKARKNELLLRKKADPYRTRENFEWVSNANPYRQKYYEHIQSIAPNGVVFINTSRDRKEILQQVLQVVEKRRSIVFLRIYMIKFLIGLSLESSKKGPIIGSVRLEGDSSEKINSKNYVIFNYLFFSLVWFWNEYRTSTIEVVTIQSISEKEMTVINLGNRERIVASPLDLTRFIEVKKQYTIVYDKRILDKYRLRKIFSSSK